MANIRRMYLRAEMSDGDTVELLNFPVQVSAREGYKVKKSRTGKAVMVFGFPMSLEEMDTVRAEFESQLAYQSRIMREDRMMRF